MFLLFLWREFRTTIFRLVTRKQHSVFWKRTMSMKTSLWSNVIQGQRCYQLSLISTFLNRSFFCPRSPLEDQSNAAFSLKSLSCCKGPETSKSKIFFLSYIPTHTRTNAHKCTSYCWYRRKLLSVLGFSLDLRSFSPSFPLFPYELSFHHGNASSLQRKAIQDTRWKGASREKGKPHYGKQQHLHPAFSAQWHAAIPISAVEPACYTFSNTIGTDHHRCCCKQSQHHYRRDCTSGSTHFCRHSGRQRQRHLQSRSRQKHQGPLQTLPSADVTQTLKKGFASSSRHCILVLVCLASVLRHKEMLFHPPLLHTINQ